jgi:hypothetical protein
VIEAFRKNEQAKNVILTFFIGMAGLPNAAGNNVFLFSTYGAPAAFFGQGIHREESRADPEKASGERVHGYRGIRVCGVEHERFPEILRGANKGRPDANDLQNAEKFARSMKGKARS